MVAMPFNLYYGFTSLDYFSPKTSRCVWVKYGCNEKRKNSAFQSIMAAQPSNFVQYFGHIQ